MKEVGPMNYFEGSEVALRYAAARPYFHPHVMQRLQARGIMATHALDVGCGTGLSTLALTTLAGRVTGIDLAAAMVALAPRQKEIACLVAAGEFMPFPDRSFELVTVSSVFHWLESTRFMAEARRVLQSRGWLVVYDNYFSAEMQENSEFRSHFQAAYFHRYPSPPRARVAFDKEELGFSLTSYEEYDNEVHFTAEILANYLTTQSNIIWAIERGQDTHENAKQWLIQLIEPFFPDGTERTFWFRGPIWILRRDG
jgi:ubiquinone/menaquinone biosynthesis C-methylase UbiE